MPTYIDIEEKSLIARDMGYGYDTYDTAILDLYYEKLWALVPIANRFHVSSMTISNRITKHHGMKLRPKGGKRKNDAPVEKPIPVKSTLPMDMDCENTRTQRGYRGGNSVWHAGVNG